MKQKGQAEATLLTTQDKRFAFLCCVLLCSLPFSYQPLIHLGQIAGFNLDVTIIYLTMMTVILCAAKRLWAARKRLLAPWYTRALLAFVAWNGISIAWSNNQPRGISVTALLVMLTFVFLAILAYKDVLVLYKKTFLKIIIIVTFFLFAFTLWQLFGDAVGASSALTVLPDAYRYFVFGFARATGFSSEPEFFGNLLLAPLSLFLYLYLSRNGTKYAVLSGLVITMIVMTLSRGALLGAGIVAILMLVCLYKTFLRKETLIFVGTALAAITLGVGLLSFAAEINKIDTISGREAFVKVIGQLSLGAINVSGRHQQTALVNIGASEDVKTSENSTASNPPAQPPISSTSPIPPQQAPSDRLSSAASYGYIAESTDSRVRMSQIALNLIKHNILYIFFGIGVGGFGATIHQQYPQHSEASIVNNQYIEVLIELGTIGLGLFMAFIILVIRQAYIARFWPLLPGLIAIMTQWIFFSGYPNILHLFPLLGVAVALTTNSTPPQRPTSKHNTKHKTRYGRILFFSPKAV